MQVKLIWITPNAEATLVHMARVSNPKSQSEGKNAEGLINYLKKHHHWSPFEMVSACFEIITTRDIARQILRHRSFAFQEFSQRYAFAEFTDRFREARLQDVKNRQNSFETTDDDIHQRWMLAQERVKNLAQTEYDAVIGYGVAKEVARALLPEGLTQSRMYMTGSFRSWYHYLDIRRRLDTQKEHRDIADAISVELAKHAPTVFAGVV